MATMGVKGLKYQALILLLDGISYLSVPSFARLYGVGWWSNVM